jgi:hypothetical protein
MHSTETINQFLNLRVQGWSFARIADQLHVSKPTLLAWNRKHQTRLESMKANQELCSQHSLQVPDQHELQTLTSFYNSLRRESISRTLKAFSDDEIQILESEILERINRLTEKVEAPSPVRLSPTQSNPVQPNPTTPSPCR